MDTVDIRDIIAAFIDAGCRDLVQLRYLLYYYKSWGLTVYDLDLVGELKSHRDGPLFAEYSEMTLKYKDTKSLRDSLEGYGELMYDEAELLNRVIETYGDLSNNELSCLVRSEGPWLSARSMYSTNSLYGDLIEDKDIVEYYSKIYKG